MRRRQVFRALTATLAVTTAGCGSGGAHRNLPAVSHPVTDVTFELLDPNAYDEHPNAPPAVAFPDDSQLVVAGRIAVGSDACKEAALERVAYDEEADALYVTVTHGKSAAHPDNQFLGGACDDEMSVDAYRATVAFAEALPGAVVATERDAGGNVETTKATPGSTPEALSPRTAFPRA